MYVFAIVLQDGCWHHIDNYAKERVSRQDMIRLRNKLSIKENSILTNRYSAKKAAQKTFQGCVTVITIDGQLIIDEIAVANSHPLGANPFSRNDFIRKSKALTDNFLTESESNNFLEVL